MPAYDNPRGFVEHRHLGGATHPRTVKRRVKANGASGWGVKRAGSPVHLVSGNTVSLLTTTASGASAASLPILGIIRAVHNSDDRPFTHNLPGTPNAIPASTAGFVYVNEDPLQTYLVSTDATVVSTYIGQFVEVTAAAPNTAAGRAGYIIELSGASNTAARTRPFQIIDIAPNNLDGIVGGERNQDVEVIIADHVWKQVVQAPGKSR